mmetsp:Transcript_28578/g.60604  ORF Transcript_28578/g.60604 Transcript_28578/m.60604 type:complete len:237 (-) Transcript_28578:158-868(-)
MTSRMGPAWSFATCAASSDFVIVPSDDGVRRQTRTVCPRIELPSATPALTVTTLRSAPDDSAGRPATLTVFSCPPRVPRLPCELGATDHSLAVPSQLPLTSHGASPSLWGGIHDRLVTAFVCPSRTCLSSWVLPSMTLTFPSLHPVTYTSPIDSVFEHWEEESMAVIWWGWRVFAPPGWISNSGSPPSPPPLLLPLPSALGFFSSDNDEGGRTMRDTTPPCDPERSSSEDEEGESQ